MRSLVARERIVKGSLERKQSLRPKGRKPKEALFGATFSAWAATLSLSELAEIQKLTAEAILAKVG